MGILKDMAEGESAEQRLISLLQNAGLEAIKNTDTKTRKFWDVEAILIDIENGVNIAEFTIEVKNDKYALRSGNIAVEIFNPKSKKESGLTVTQAELWAVMVGDEFWICSTARLRRFVDEEKPHRIVDVGGDNNATMLLYKKEHIFTIFHRVDGTKADSLRRLIEGLL